MRIKMKKFSVIALAFSAGAVFTFALTKLLGKKCSCKKYYDDEFDDNCDNYDFETDCCADEDLEVVIPAEENDETVEVKVEEKAEPEETPAEKSPAEEKTEE